ncbi:ABC transporter permease [Nocardiopsis changdeensis]|uniref:ABC transporter permease n=1 Tax=Nocardiopsis changdeensis TaxID=2831969 RepID=A0ABX8BKL4_9ACTN|nr:MULTISPECIES: ABC transporter permease [Nocardiopsis]QUX22557.1 ABC transporter permease [Nocardiopsis changdeensis]QYX38498.1 ABC transporter permease [Nocardiopsis sp. MT53]
MLVYTARRLAVAIPVLLAASVLVFLMVDLSGDPLADLRMQQPPPSEQVIADAEARYYLDRSIPERYWLWMTGIGGNGDIGLLQGQFGPSVRGVAFDIGTELSASIAVTLRLVTAAVIAALGLAILSGVVSAMRQYSKLDYTLTFIGFLALAMPTFWLGALIKEGGLWFNQTTGSSFFFTIGANSARVSNMTNWEYFLDSAGHLVLPTITLMLTSFASWSRYQRTSMLEVLNSDYVRLARAKGVPNRVVVRRHALRTALIPLVTVATIGIVGIIEGVVITETIFQWRGLGYFFIEAVKAQDAFAVMSWLMLSGTLVVVANLVADILYGVLDPRIRYE